ncbi:HxlR family transcriptional regulator [Neobacillus bataviensis LMG 21833]|uniref:HxlR family transcriptional regulator n=1 Tax=Neobacillus bataviensis LMG 21833 TaxID=1117379 RepID=K6DTZ7_9BACI|nr:helix-turn-helix domain-containing protein [Neobacillus bataviensis]EKN71738.1 HxlR family transcriptional regulator [Neobacillus bataviensis LMG 21833]
MDNKPDHCRVATTMEMIIGKWKIAIMLNLVHYGTMRFSELQHVMPGVTQKVLTSHLRDLEQEGIVERVVYPQVPPKVEYSMTEYGKSLQTILEMMHDWGEAHIQRKTQMLFSKGTDNQKDKNN